MPFLAFAKRVVTIFDLKFCFYDLKNTILTVKVEEMELMTAD
jgi:hypothetical protein